MDKPRQLPLFPSQPLSLADLNRHTALRDTVSLFQAQLRRDGKSEHTVKAFTADLQLLADHAGEDTRLGDLSTRRLNEFLAWMEKGRGVPCSRKSYARRVTTLKVFFRWLRDAEVLPRDPAKPLLQRSGPAPLSQVLSPAQAEAALRYAESLATGPKPDARPALLFRLLLETGIKKSEMARLSPDDVDRANPDKPILLVRHRRGDEVFRERKIALTPDVLPLLDAYIAQYQPADALFDCTPRNLEYVLEDVGQAADIPFKVSFEIMRWTSAVRDHRAGVEPAAIRDKLGLSDVSWYETFAKVKRLTERQASGELQAASGQQQPASEGPK